MTVTTLCIRAVRRQAIAAAFVLAMREGEQGDGCGSGSSSPSTMSTAARGMLRRFFLAADGGGSKTKAPRQRAAVARSLAQQLLPDWLGGLADALRFVQGQGLWPALGASSSTRGGSLRGGGGGCTYGGGVDAQRYVLQCLVHQR